MKRFVTIARYSEQMDMECPDIGMAQTVYEPERVMRDTGLIDASGGRIFSVEEMDQIGFVRWPSTC